MEKERNLGDGLIEADRLIERGYSLLSENIGKAIALITGVVAALVVFTEVGFYGADLESLTPTLVLMLIASYVIFLSMEDAGERYAKGSEEYLRARDALDAARGRVGGNMLPSFRRFCLEYAEEEREYRISALLTSHGWAPSEYEAYRRGGEVSREGKRVFRRADRIGRVSISPHRILGGNDGGSGGEVSSPEGKRLLSILTKLLPTTLCMLLTVSVMLSGRDGMTPADVIEGILRLSTLPVVAMKGYTTGYGYVKGPLVGWLDARRRLIEVFLAREESAASSKEGQPLPRGADREIEAAAKESVATEAE